jgi:site-specific recombinase XerD
MKTVHLVSLKHKGGHWLKIQSDTFIVEEEFATQFRGSHWSEAHESALILYTKNVVNELFTYFRAKGYYVDYSRVRSSSMLLNKGKEERRKRKEDGLSVRKRRYYNTYISYLEGLRLSNSTINVYSNFVADFLLYIKHRELKTLSNEDVMRFTEIMVKNKAYGISTHRQMVSAIKHFAKRFEETKIDNFELKRPTRDRRLPSVLSQEEILALELAALDVGRCQILIRNSKGRKDRYVVMAQSFIPLLKNYLFTYKPRGYFIEGLHSRPYSASSVRKFLSRSCKKAGIKKHVTPHTLRHSYATHLIENGVGLRYIQELLGHSKPETTMIYTHIAKKDLLQIQSPLDNAVLGLLESDKKPQKVFLSGKFLR